MARNENDKRKSGGTQVAEPLADEAQPESLDKVRDILFGSQMRAVETRLQGMEERLRGEHEALRSDFARQVESLDAFIRSEGQSLGERLAQEINVNVAAALDRAPDDDPKAMLRAAIASYVELIDTETDVYRFVTERAVSTDTTSAGGNATLLSLDEGGI